MLSIDSWREASVAVASEWLVELMLDRHCTASVKQKR